MLTTLLAALLLAAQPGVTYPSHNACLADCTKMQTECELAADVDSCANGHLMCVARCDRLLIEGKFCMPKCDTQWRRCMNAPFSTPRGCDRGYEICEADCQDAAFR